MNITRRAFAEGAMTLLGGAFVPFDAFAGAVAPRMKFGVVSDVHIGGRKEAVANLEKALRWLDAQKVDAVAVTGDTAHSGVIPELEAFAKTWQKVFPGRRAADGRPVELMVVTGNHEIGLWPGRWKNFSEARLRECAFEYGDNPARTWERLFGEKWELVWKKEVKGVTFFGSQWFSLRPPVEAVLKEQAAKLDPSKPFFFFQHPHPKGTCYEDGRGFTTGAYDGGVSTRALSAFPNAVAISGHSHFTLADERSVWQGAFTSIGAGCLHEGGYSFGYANASAFWHPSFREHLMKPLGGKPEWGGDPTGACFSLYEVYDDHIVVHRRSLRFDRPLGPAWVIPVPARADGPFDFARRAKETDAAPEFAPGAEVAVEFCPAGHDLEGVSFVGQPCVRVSFPPARQKPSGRPVFEYAVTAIGKNGKTFARTVLAPGCTLPHECADLPGECLFLPTELPNEFVFSVSPRDCYGCAGAAIRSRTCIRNSRGEVAY